MNDDNHICRKARIIPCKKIFKYFQTNLLFLRVAGFLVLFFNIHKNIDSSLKRSLVGFGHKLHTVRFHSLLDYCKKQKGKKKPLGKTIPCRKAGDGCKAPKKITY